MKYNKRDEKQAKGIIKQIEKEESTLPEEEKNILEWTTGELRAYIMDKTRGLKPIKKMEFANNLIKRIEHEKKIKGIKK